MNNLLLLIIGALAFLNIVNGRKKSRAEEKLRNIERQHDEEKAKIITNEREAARRRLRDYLENYRGPSGKA